MKKLVLFLFVLPLLAVFNAKADEIDTNPTTDVSTEAVAQTYTCKLYGHMKGLNVAIGLGGEVIRGNGTFTCVNDVTGRTSRIPVRLSLVGGGAGFEFSVIRSMVVRTAGIKVSNPRRFFRTYGIGATTGASLIGGGIEFDGAFKVDGDADDGGGFEVGLSGRDVRGLGVHLYGMGFKIARR